MMSEKPIQCVLEDDKNGICIAHKGPEMYAAYEITKDGRFILIKETECISPNEIKAFKQTAKCKVCLEPLPNVILWFPNQIVMWQYVGTNLITIAGKD